jgi:hypothetical protein
MPARTLIETAICWWVQRGSGPSPRASRIGSFLSAAARAFSPQQKDRDRRSEASTPTTSSASTPPTTTEVSRVGVIFDGTQPRQRSLIPAATSRKPGRRFYMSPSQQLRTDDEAFSLSGPAAASLAPKSPVSSLPSVTPDELVARHARSIAGPGAGGKVRWRLGVLRLCGCRTPGRLHSLPLRSHSLWPVSCWRLTRLDGQGAPSVRRC